ncbi:hypothetical protein KKA94_02420 [Patescibacteria group bacterium]|nr:hypothetical protein [Patescibacteria group bacterium]
MKLLFWRNKEKLSFGLLILIFVSFGVLVLLATTLVVFIKNSDKINSGVENISLEETEGVESLESETPDAVSISYTESLKDLQESVVSGNENKEELVSDIEYFFFETRVPKKLMGDHLKAFFSIKALADDSEVTAKAVVTELKIVIDELLSKI